jgi:hypothetical protein
MCKIHTILWMIIWIRTTAPLLLQPAGKKADSSSKENSLNKQRKGLVSELIMCTFAAANKKAGSS